MNAISAVYRTKAMETPVVNPIHGTVGWRKTGSGELEGLLWSTKTMTAGWIKISEYVQHKKDRAEAFRQHCKVNPRALYDKIQGQKDARLGRCRERVTYSMGDGWMA